MLDYKPDYEPSETFDADQGLPDTTEIDLDHETDFMYEFIALIVGEPISLWDLYQEYIKMPQRSLQARVEIDGIMFGDDNIVEITIDETVNPDDSITLGSVASSKLDITIYNKSGTKYTDAKVYPEIGLDVDGEMVYLQLGEFTVDDVEKNKDRINLTCFDNMIKLEKSYESNLNYPTSLNQVALEIAQMAGVTLVSTLPNTFVDEIKGYTLRQAIGFVASFVGGFAKFNRNGDLVITSFVETDETITADNYIDLQTPENAFSVGKIACKVSNDNGDTELVAGIGGTGITFENPIMTQSQLNSLFNDLKTLSFMPFDMEWQGNPMLSAGHKVKITDINNQVYTSLVMDQQLKYTGGLRASTSAKGKSETAQDFDFKGSLKEEIDRIKKEQNDRDPNVTPGAPSSLTATGLYENIKLEWIFEDVRYIDVYEVYASQIEGFVPNESNLVWVGKSGSFNFFAKSNEHWYFRVRGINTRGVAGPYSSQVDSETVKINTPDIMFGSVTQDLLAELAVSSDKIQHAAIKTVHIEDAAIKRAHLQEAIIDNVHIADATIEYTKIKSINADTIEAGIIRGIDIVGSKITSFNTATNDVITLENGEITTFEDGSQRFGIYGNGLVAYHWETESEVATFRATHRSNEAFGAGIMASGDYFTIGRREAGASRTSLPQLDFTWDGNHDDVYLYGGSGERDSGYLRLQSTRKGGSAGGRVPHLVVDNRTSNGTAYSGARIYLGRDNRKPSSSNFRSGFEVWQYKGDGKGGTNQLLRLDTGTSGKTHLNAWVEELYVEGNIDIDGGLEIGGKSNFYGDLDMKNWNITNVKDIAVNRFRANETSGRYLELYNTALTAAGWGSGSHNGVALTRGTSPRNGGVFFHGNRSYLMGGTDDKFALFGVGSDSTSGLVHSYSIYNRTYTSTSQIVRVTQNGILGMSTSSRRYKINEKIIGLEYAKRIHDINAVSWYDKRSAEDYCHTLSTGEETEVQKVVRIGGVIAEDIHNAGLEMYVNYDDKNRPHGVASFMWTLLIPISKDHENRLDVYEIKLTSHDKEISILKEKVNDQQNKINFMQQEIDQLKGVA